MRDLSTTNRTHGARWGRWWLHALGHGILFTLLGHPVAAAERLELDTFSVYPPQPKVELDLDDGSTCSVTDRAPPTLIVYGRQLNSLDRLSSNALGLKSDLGGGVALMIPLGGTGLKQICSGLLKLQEARARMALANQLLEAGQINDADMQKIVARLRQMLGI